MTITLDGTLGITSPAETVQGALTTTGNTILGDASTDTLNVGNGGLVKDASGNVGIGTASPAYKLDVNGSIKLSGLNAGSGLLLDLAGSQDYQIKETSSDDVVQFGSNNTTGFRHNISSGNLQFNSGYGSIATAYGCRAWVNFNGTGTVAIRASGNVSSITDNGTGDYTVNFTTAMVDANYAISGSGAQDNTGSQSVLNLYSNTARLVGSARINTVNGVFTLTDMLVVAVSVFR